MTRFVTPTFTPQDSVGRAIPGAMLYFFEAGTTTPKATYADFEQTNPNTHPVVADGGGMFTDIFMESGGYRVELRDGDDVLLWDRDNLIINQYDLIEVGYGGDPGSSSTTSTMFQKFNDGTLVNYIDFKPTGFSQSLNIAIANGGFTSNRRTASVDGTPVFFEEPFINNEYFLSSSLTLPDEIETTDEVPISVGFANPLTDRIDYIFYSINSATNIKNGTGFSLTATGRWLPIGG